MSLSKIVAMGTVAYHDYSLETALKGIRRAQGVLLILISALIPVVLGVLSVFRTVP